MMGSRDIAIVFATLVPVMFAWRVVPMFVLKGRELSPELARALGLIPAAAFAALVANDLFDPEVVLAAPGQFACGIVSSLIVYVVAKKTGSLIWCALAGMASYALIGMALGVSL